MDAVMHLRFLALLVLKRGEEKLARVVMTTQLLQNEIIDDHGFEFDLSEDLVSSATLPVHLKKGDNFKTLVINMVDYPRLTRRSS